MSGTNLARDFSEKERKEDAKKGDALPDGSFPIENKEDLENAEALKNKGKNPAAAERLIEKREKELGVSDKKSKWHVVSMTGACPNCSSPLVGANCPSCGYADQTGATDGNYKNPGTGLSPNPDMMPPAAMASTKKSKWHVAIAPETVGYGDPWAQGADDPVGAFDQQNYGGEPSSRTNEQYIQMLKNEIMHTTNPQIKALREQELQEALMGQQADQGEQGNAPGGLAFASTHTALGEVQQPSAIAAPAEQAGLPEQDPNYLPMDDVRGMSRDQEVAFQKWVDLAVDMLNQGQPQQEILAELAHEGCDDPQAILVRAMEQPLNSDNNLHDPPIPQEPPMAEGSPEAGQGVSQPPSFQAKVKGTNIVGKVESQYEDLYGRQITRIATPFGSREVLTDQIEPITQHDVDPVNLIHELLDGMPKLEDNKGSVEARIANLRMASEMCRKAVYSNVTSEQMQKIAEIEDNTRIAILNLTSRLAKYKPSLDEYLASQPKFSYDAYGLEDLYVGDKTVETTAYAKVMDEHPILVVHDLSKAERLDPIVVKRAAADHISQYVWELPPRTRRELTEQFVEAALKVASKEEPEPDWTPKTASTENPADFDGPASAIFL